MEFEELLKNNQAWAEAHTKADPRFFPNMAKVQNPNFMWIGCADARVSCNTMCQASTGEIFVHRNVANLVTANDINALSAIAFAVNTLKVKDIIICGHSFCGGVAASLVKHNNITDAWLSNLHQVYRHHRLELEAIDDQEERVNSLAKLSIYHQICHLAQTTIVENAWARDQPLVLHGVYYDLEVGMLKPLENAQLKCHDDLVNLYSFLKIHTQN